MLDEWRIENDLEGRYGGVIEVISWNFAREAEENHRKADSG
jgi:hypothetical protein